MTLDEFARSAIGVPFVESGRDRDGWDCYGLAVVAWRDIAGVYLPDATYDSVNNFRFIADLFNRRDESYWCQVDAPMPMAIAGIYRRGLVIHAGLVIDYRRILHVEKGIETCLEPITNFRIEGFYAPSCGTASV